MFGSVFKKSFSSAKCKTLLRLATSRIKLLRNKREVQLKQLKRELAKSLETNQEPSAHLQVERIYREQNIMAAYEIIELLCDLLVSRLPIIASQKQCPIDLREAVGSIIYAAPRCSDIPELKEIRSLLTAKYGKEFTAIAAELRPDCGVNRVVIEKLSVKGPSIEVKLKLMKDIATEHGLEWDPSDLESQNLRASEDLLDGPSRFFAASQMSMQKSFKESSTNEPISQQTQSNGIAEAKTTVVQNTEFSDEKQFIPFIRPMVEDNMPSSGGQVDSKMMTMQGQDSSSNSSPHGLSANYFSQGVSANYSSHSLSAASSHTYDDSLNSRPTLDRRMSLKGVANAAHAAAEAAENAAAAARMAAQLASEKFERDTEGSSSDSETDDDGDELSELPEDKHLNPGRAPLDDRSTSRMPLFDEPVEEKGSHWMQSPGESLLRHGKSNEQSIFCKESYDFDSTESVSQSMTSFERHVNGQANRQQLDSSNSFSSNWHYQHKNTRPKSFAAAPSFDTYKWDDPGIHTADEIAQSKPPDRPPPRLPEAPVPTLTKSISFVHPKLPDYDNLTAHFQALKAMKSRK